MNYIQWP